MKKIGVDIGGVIIDRGNDNEDTSLFGEKYLSARAVVGAVDALVKLNKELFPGNVYIVSKCGEKIEKRSREWLKANEVCQKAGIPESNLHFCRERADKAPIARRLGLTHFVDDRLEVLGYMRGIVGQRILFAPEPKGLQQYGWTSGPVILAFAWKDVLEWLSDKPVEKTLSAVAESLRGFFIARQEVEFARAVTDLDRVRNGGAFESDEAFVYAKKAVDQLIEEQRFDKASDLRDLMSQARNVVEKA